MLTVSPELQGKGLGKMLLEESEAFAQFWDCSHIVMTVIASRIELIAWYERHGFKKTGETKPFPYGEERFGIPKVENLHFVVLKKAI
jgi:ribosomal protein S18 acetylase RimI-like enzyme